MKISILTDNHSGVQFQAEHGLSYIIEHDGKKILFDTGQTDIFKKNADKMNIDILDIDLIILSHGHLDHGNGLEYLKGGKLVCHPGCFRARYRKVDSIYIGLKSTMDEIDAKFDLMTSIDPYFISGNIVFLGEIPRENNFESQTTPFVFADGSPDFVSDDSALAMRTDKGLFLVTGCGHSGIVNTAEHAKRITGENRIYGIIGGFHLKEINHQTRETVRYLKENKVKYVLPSHCTELPSLSVFYKSFGMEQVKTGDILSV
jgi:7,8-dihydropterin-6-yl-methyl-4-(beta-D-ribofuranosyl)aminobenzene 5'-phosphate synthase